MIFTCALNLSAQSIVIENMQFNSSDVTVSLGRKILWINKDLVPHTVTADNKSFNSPVILPGKSWTFKPLKKGSVSYSCSLHPVMHGKFTVK